MSWTKATTAPDSRGNNGLRPVVIIDKYKCFLTGQSVSKQRGGDSITQNGVKINFDHGAKVAYANNIPPLGDGAIIAIEANNVVINGGDISDLTQTYATGGDCIGIARRALNTTLNNVYAHDCTMGLLAGGQYGNLIVNNSIFARNGDQGGSGNYHNFYASWFIGQTDNDTVAWNNSISQDQLLSGNFFKCRAAACTMNGADIYCSSSAGTIFTACNPSYMVDAPCAGQLNVQNAVIERLHPDSTYFLAIYGAEANDGPTAYAGGHPGGCMQTTGVGGTAHSGTSLIDGIPYDAQQQGAAVGMSIECRNFDAGCNGTVFDPTSIISSFGGNAGNYSITVTCASNPSPCFTANITSTESFTISGPLKLVGASGSANGCANNNTICNLTINGRAYDPNPRVPNNSSVYPLGTYYITSSVGYQVSGTGIEAGSTVSAISTAGSPPYSISLKCSSPPCVTTPEASTAFTTGRAYSCTFNHVTFINDNPLSADGGNAVALVKNYLKPGAVQNGFPTTSCVVTNSNLVTNTGSQALSYGDGVTDGGGNHIYASRTSAGVSNNWSATDSNGNPCCNFPYLPPLSGTSPLSTLVGNMAHNSFKLISPSAGDNSNMNLLPLTCANFDGLNATACHNGVLGGTFANESAVAASVAQNNWAFSSAETASDGSKACMTGGGHSDGADGSFYCFDIQAAAAQVNNAQTLTTKWNVLIPSGRLIPVTQPRPAWSHQSSDSDAGGCPQNTAPPCVPWPWWTTTNSLGQKIWCAGQHTNGSMIKQVRRTRLFTTVGFACSPEDAGNAGAAFFGNIDTGAITGPLVTTAAVPHPNPQQRVNDAGLAMPGGQGLCFDLNGVAYTVGNDQYGYSTLWHWTTPTNSSLALFNDGTIAGVPPQNATCLIVPDPTNPAYGAFFSHAPISFSLPGGNPNVFILVTGLDSGMRKDRGQINYSGGVPANCRNVAPPLDYDSTRRRIITWLSASHICAVTLNSTLASTTMTEVTNGFTSGDIPHVTYIGGHNQPRIRYIAKDASGNTVDAYVLIDAGYVWVYRP